jgi:hypothetical protein
MDIVAGLKTAGNFPQVTIIQEQIEQMIQVQKATCVRYNLLRAATAKLEREAGVAEPVFYLAGAADTGASPLCLWDITPKQEKTGN